mgnify:CR=1 FL=1
MASQLLQKFLGEAVPDSRKVTARGGAIGDSGGVAGVLAGLAGIDDDYVAIDTTANSVFAAETPQLPYFNGQNPPNTAG